MEDHRLHELCLLPEMHFLVPGSVIEKFVHVNDKLFVRLSRTAQRIRARSVVKLARAVHLVQAGHVVKPSVEELLRGQLLPPRPPGTAPISMHRNQTPLTKVSSCIGADDDVHQDTEQEDKRRFHGCILQFNNSALMLLCYSAEVIETNTIKPGRNRDIGSLVDYVK